MEYKWERAHLEKLIVYVQEYTCLYNVKSKEYLDRVKKAAAFNSIKEKLEEDVVGVTVEDIKKKWRNLRTQYLREIRLINNSKKSGSGTSEIYKSKFWCYDQLTFLQGHTSMRPSVDNTDSFSSNSQLDDLDLSTDESSNVKLTCKRPKKTYSDERQEFKTLKENLMNKTKKKFAWLGNLVSTQMDEIIPHKQQEAAWAVQQLMQKYIAMGRKELPSSSSSSQSEGVKDILQMSMEGVFDVSDLTE